MLQVVLVFLPEEPVQVLGGLTFGFNIGFLLCILGVIAGNTLIFLMYKLFGEKMSAYFDENLEIDLDKFFNKT
jgi:uncharacterized membrane protein YdjX (TVP38/TMEM64 family)